MLHFVSPIEPDDGALGQDTREFHAGYCRTNWIAFRVEGGKYNFLGDFRFFKIYKGFEGPHALANHEYLKSNYAKAEASFGAAKANFEQTGKLHQPRYLPSVWLKALGGEAAAGNWAEDQQVEKARDKEGLEIAFPITTDGRRFRFVGEMCGGAFRKYGPDGVLLFFDPQTQTALLTFEWT